MPPQPRFTFMDAVDVMKRLQVDRATLDKLVQEGKLKSYMQGKAMFFKAGEVETLAQSLAPAHALAADEEEEGGGKKTDPAQRVSLRLRADLKWYDIPDADLQAWYRQLDPSHYDINIKLIKRTMSKLSALLQLLEERQQAKESKEENRL